MKRKTILVLLAISFILVSFLIVKMRRLNNYKGQVIIKKTTIDLPQPRLKSQISIEEALFKRRSVREFKKQPVTLTEISQLLWAAQGITEKTKGLRTAPSAGALYPLEIYLVASYIDWLPAGIYKYQPDGHLLLKIKEGNYQEDLYKTSLKQESVREAPAAFVFSAVYERTTRKYGQRGRRYVEIEVGHAAQNIYLQTVSLNLGAVVIGAFDDEEMKKIIQLPKEEDPLYMLVIGKK